MKRTIILDVVTASDLLEAPQSTKFGEVTFELVQEHGPASGHPVVSATGEDAALFEWLLKEYTDGDEDDAVYYLTESTK